MFAAAKRFGLMLAFAPPGAFLSGRFDGRVVRIVNIGVREGTELSAFRGGLYARKCGAALHFVAVCLLVAGRP